MIHDLDESLRELAKRDVLNGSNVEIAFDAPTKDWSARQNTPTINLYLYDIREDLTRREVQFVEVRDENGLITGRKLPPRKFKLSYLITAWTQRPEDEHRLLSAMLACFLRFDALPPEIMQGSMASVEEPVRCTIGLPLPEDRSISDVWSALGGELKPSLDLVITAPFETRRDQVVLAWVLEEPRLRLRGADGEDEHAEGKGMPGRRNTGGGGYYSGPQGETHRATGVEGLEHDDFDWEVRQIGRDEKGRMIKFGKPKT